MTDKNKGRISILMMAVFFFINLETKYTRALGDYILEFLGIASWSNGNKGLHLTLIYFGVLFMISFFLVKKNCIEKLKYSRKKIFIIFAVLVTLFSVSTNMIAETIKKTSDGLLSIGYDTEYSEMEYQFRDNEYVEFNADFQLTNYSYEDREFYISIKNSYIGDGEESVFSFYTYDGEKAKFYLEGEESKSFNLSLDQYKVEGGPKGLNGGGAAYGFEILLTDDQGEKVLLGDNNFFGLKISK